MAETKIPILSGEPTGKPVIEIPTLKKVDLEALRDGLYECLHCGMCRQVLPSLVKSHRFGFGCPAGARYKFDAYFSSGRTEILRRLFSGEFDFEDSPELHENVQVYPLWLLHHCLRLCIHCVASADGACGGGRKNPSCGERIHPPGAYGNNRRLEEGRQRIWKTKG